MSAFEGVIRIGEKFIVTEKTFWFNQGEIIEYMENEDSLFPHFVHFYPPMSHTPYVAPLENVVRLSDYFEDAMNPTQQEVDYFNMIYNTRHTLKHFQEVYNG